MTDARVLLGRPVARGINEEALERNQAFAKKHGRPPRLAVLASADEAAESYLRTIRYNSKKVEAEISEVPVSPDADLEQIRKEIHRLNEDSTVDGILVQAPLPEGVNTEDVGGIVDHTKDVDGITPYQSGLLFRGSREALVPPTARAVIEILDYYGYGLAGLEVVIVGRSLVVGKPLGILVLGRHATVTWCHSRTQGLAAVCKRAEILISATGKPRMIDPKFVRPSATIIDVGINVDEDGNLCGDVDSESIKSMASAYTPVPGGVGPVTTACLFDNLLKAAKSRHEMKL